MQKGVLIKDGSGNVIEKRVYGGDMSNLAANLTKEGVIYTILEDNDPVFVAAKTPASLPSLEDRVSSLESAVTLVAKQANVAISLPDSVGVLKNG